MDNKHSNGCGHPSAPRHRCLDANANVVEVPDLVALAKNRRDDETLTDDEYLTMAEYAALEVRRLCLDLSLWKHHSTNASTGIQIFERKSESPHALESMLLLIVTLPSSVEKLETLLTPWLGYRLQWDTFLADAELIKSWPDEEVYLLRHLVKKLYTISARESIDIVKVLRTPTEVVFGTTGVSHADYPPTKGYVRTHQYLGGYLLQPVERNRGDEASDDAENRRRPHTKFHMLFHADLNLAGPRFFSALVAKLKPTLMAQKMENLRGAIEKFDI